MISFCFWLFPSGLISQIFQRIDSIPVKIAGNFLENPWAGGLNTPQFSSVDINMDGKKDLFVFDRTGNRILPLINYGNTGEINWKYEKKYSPSFPPLKYWALLVDYDNDGKEDIFCSNRYDFNGDSINDIGVAVYRNVSDQYGLHFVPEKILLLADGYNLYVSEWDIPAITDIDYDGDIDILTFIGGTLMFYYKNLSVELYGNSDSLVFTMDNSCWGYFKEAAENCSVTLSVSCKKNIPPPPSKPLHEGSTTLAIDLDGDHDMEVIIGDVVCTNMYQLTNGGDSSAAVMTYYEPAYPPVYPIDLYRFPAAFWLDVDNDYRNDLIVAPNGLNVSENFTGIWFYKNFGDNSIPLFQFQKKSFLQDQMIEVGENAYPVFFDYNSDGLLDIVIGNYGYYAPTGNYPSSLALFKNTGTNTSPSFELITRDYTGLNQYGFSAVFPAFGDLDGDGDYDMLIGEYFGYLHHFENIAPGGSAADFVLINPQYKDIDVGKFSAPQITDVNGDSLPDLLVGEINGNINYFRNTGTMQNPEYFMETDSFGKVDVRVKPGVPGYTGYSIPWLARWDSTGYLILLVGTKSGGIYRYTGIEGNLTGKFTLTDTLFSGIYEGVQSSVSGGDINGDSVPDLIIGNLAGGVTIYYNYAPPPDSIPSDSVIPVPVPFAISKFGIDMPGNNFIIQFRGTDENDIADIRFFDIRGRNIYSTQYSGAALTQENKIPFHTFTDGIYFVKLSVGEYKRVVKLAVIRE